MALPKITFAMTYCERDAALVNKSQAALESLYPEARVIVIADNPRIKLPGFQGQWTERWMKAALATDADIIVKIDPDTRAMRVATFPTEDVFGQMAPTGAYYPNSNGIISGGAIGFQQAAVQKIVDSGFLRDTKYDVKPYATEERRFGTPRETILLQDFITHDVAERLNLTKGDWPGLHLKFSWEADQNVHPKNATFIHPVKE